MADEATATVMPGHVFEFLCTNTTTAVPAIGCTCGAWWLVGDPPPCPVHSWHHVAPYVPYVPCTYPQTYWLTHPPADPPSLSDADVKRIAREVVRLMRADGHDPGDEDA